MKDISGGQLAADALVERGVEFIYTLSGGHITPIYQYLEKYLEKKTIRLIDTRHEQAAVFMAEAYGKLTRKPGVAMVTAGPGFTNSLTGIASASISNTPLVLISGAVGLNNTERLDLQDIPQAPVIAPMVKKTFICQKTERIPEYFDLAFRTATSGRPGPVYLELPVDILNTVVDPSTVQHTDTMTNSRPVDMDKAGVMIEMLEKSKNPIVIAGSGAWFSGCENALTEFIDKTGAPAFTMMSGRGVIPDTHPLCFESSLGIRPGAAMFANMTTDLVIMLGSRLSLYYIFGNIFNPMAKIIQVDINPEEIGRNRKIDLPVFSDIKALLTACNKIIDEKDLSRTLMKKFEPWVKTLHEEHHKGKEAVKSNLTSDAVPIHPMRITHEINEFMNREDDIVVADGGDTTTWMGMTRTIRKSGHYLDYGLFGSLAVGLPYANAAKLLYPDKRVCLITGDGSIGFNFMEFENAIRKNLPIVAVISNDLGWGMIRHSQEIRIGHAIKDGTYIGKVNYHKLVEDLGGKGFYVDKPEDIRPALEEAFASGKTACINIMSDPTTVSPGSVALANIGAYKA